MGLQAKPRVSRFMNRAASSAVDSQDHGSRNGKQIHALGNQNVRRVWRAYDGYQELAEETGGEVMEEKPERLDTTFATLIDHLRTRYNLAFVSSNRKRDGSLRKLKIDLSPEVQSRRENWS